MIWVGRCEEDEKNWDGTHKANESRVKNITGPRLRQELNL